MENFFSLSKSITLLVYSLIFRILLSDAIAQTIEHTDDDPPLKWIGVEVVTNKVEMIPAIRSLSKISPGDSFRMSDPRPKEACDSVRSGFPRFKVSCTAVLMENATALYVIQTTTSPRKILKTRSCKKAFALPPDLMALAQNTTTEIEKQFKKKSNAKGNEFINEDEILDNSSPELHEMALATSKTIRGRLDQLAIASQSCDPEMRANSIQLFNYAGNAKLTINNAAILLNDPDESVRNNALRIISSFAKFVSPSASERFVETACANLEKETFLDRNKSIMILHELIENNIIKPETIKNTCLTRIRELARYSLSDQIGSPAKAIIRVIEK